MKSGMRVQLIPRARMLWIVTMKLIARDRGCRQDVQREDPQVLAVSRSLRRERRVRGPAGVRGASVGEEAQHQHGAPRRKSQYERVQPREGDVSPIMSGTR